jgi:aspartate dehydrogenase
VSALRYHKGNPLRVALAGFGNVGQQLAPRLAAGEVPHTILTAITANNLEKARTNAKGLSPAPKIVPLAELPEHADVIVECATYESFPEIARVTVTAGKTLICVSAGALAAHLDLIDLAEKHHGVIHIATGAMPGMDILRSAKESGLKAVRLRSRMKPEALAKEPWVQGQGFDFSTPPKEAVKVFGGSAREAANAFPRHYNVAVTLSLSGAGLDDTRIDMWCDPAIPGAIHHVEVESEAVDLNMESRNRPSKTNKNTSQIVAPSILAALRQMVSPIRCGS